MKASIVIPNWNGEKELIENLPQVIKVKGIDEVIIVDDCSTDSSLKILNERFPNIKIIKKDKNTGFSSTVNKGVKEARGDLVFLLNTDARPTEDSFHNTLKHFSEPKVFSVSCNTGGNFSWAKFEKGFFWHFMAKRQGTLVSHQTLWASGGNGVFRKSIWEKLGGFDETFDPFYEEDVDLGYRATKRGYINIWDPTSIVDHSLKEGVISQNFQKREIETVAQRNQLIFIWKNITDQSLIRKHFLYLTLKLLANPRYLIIFFTALLKLPSILSKRATEIRESELTDEQILNLRYN